jgi:hypothetical protein
VKAKPTKRWRSLKSEVEVAVVGRKRSRGLRATSARYRHI